MPSTAKKPTAPTALEVGDTAPGFSMSSTASTQTLAQYKGKKHVVLYFYPKDDTPGCTLEAKDFRDLSKEFAKADAVVIGVSKDDMKSHEKFCAKFDLNFALASDADGTVCDAYGTWVEKNMYGKKYMGIQRATYLIDKTGKIAAIWPKVSVTGHAAEVLKAAKKLAD
ncbi:MAG: peroxiredoxin [Rickettsiales bacterium]